VSAGEHTLHAHKEHYVFAPRALQISPNAPTLPELRPERYQVCGRLVVVPAQPRDVRLTSPALELLAYVPSRERPPIDARTHMHTRPPSLRHTDREGQFCFEVPPGTYAIRPVVSADEIEQARPALCT
jgi:hypothetical protein